MTTEDPKPPHKNRDVSQEPTVAAEKRAYELGAETVTPGGQVQVEAFAKWEQGRDWAGDKKAAPAAEAPGTGISPPPEDSPLRRLCDRSTQFGFGSRDSKKDGHTPGR